MFIKKINSMKQDQYKLRNDYYTQMREKEFEAQAKNRFMKDQAKTMIENSKLG